MRDKLTGWDLLTWRLGFEDKGIIPLVGSQITIAGQIDYETLVGEVQEACQVLEVLRFSLTNEEFPNLKRLDSFDVRQCIQVLHNHVNPAQFALRSAASEFSSKRYRDDLPLWRVYVVHQEDVTLLFPFLHHAIADGRAALEIIFTLCGKTTDKMQLPSSKQSIGFSEILEEVFSNPLSLLQKAAPALLKLSSIAALSPQHTLPNFSARSFRDDVVQFSFPRELLRRKAKDLSVSIHDLSVAFALQVVRQLESQLGYKVSTPIRVNVPVAYRNADTLNQVIIARLFIAADNLDQTAQAYRTEFQQWREQPSLDLYQPALEAVARVERIDLTSFATTSDVTVSSLPTISDHLQFAGHDVVSLWPLVPSMGSAFNVTTIGLNAEQYYTLTFDVGIKIDARDVRKAIRTVGEKSLGFAPNFQ